MIYAIGDIHGQLTMLRRMFEKMNEDGLTEADTVVFLGDYIDRGEDTRGVIDALLAFRERHANTVFLRGNHEQLMLDARTDTPPQLAPRAGYMVWGDITVNWLQNGGFDTLASYGVAGYLEWWTSIPEEHWGFYEATEMEHVTERYHFVHAGLLPPGERWKPYGFDIDPRLWIRDQFLDSEADFDGRVVVFGHTPQASGKPLLQHNKIGIDTGAVYEGPLTAAILNPAIDSSVAPRFLQIPYA